MAGRHMRSRIVVAVLAAIALPAIASASDDRAPWSPWAACAGIAPAREAGEAIPGAPYYAVDLVPTRRVVGTGLATGLGHVTFSSSPFGVAVTPRGDYVYRIDLAVERLRRPPHGVLTAWASTPELDRVTRLGPLDEGLRATGQVEWNKFLVIVTLEPEDDPAAARWTGPVILRGMSRSGMMHTLAGHGPFEREPCSKYGYDE